MRAQIQHTTEHSCCLAATCERERKGMLFLEMHMNDFKAKRVSKQAWNKLASAEHASASTMATTHAALALSHM